jgi:UDP-glucose 4-epimerase
LGDILDQVDLVYGDFMDDVTLRAALKDVEIVFHLISTTFPAYAQEHVLTSFQPAAPDSAG